MRHIGLPLVSILLIVFVTWACGAPIPPPASTPIGSPGTATRIAKDGDTVSVHYQGTLDSGEVFDSSRDRSPLTFIVGSSQVISGFEEAVRGLSVGQSVTVRLKPDQAYGVRDEDLVLEVPRSQARGGLSVGDQVRLANGEPAVVLEVKGEVVRIDMNHPLAGQAVTFDIELVSIQ